MMGNHQAKKRRTIRDDPKDFAMEERLAISATAVIFDHAADATYLRTVECFASGPCYLMVPGNVVAAVRLTGNQPADLAAMRRQEARLRAVPQSVFRAALPS